MNARDRLILSLDLPSLEAAEAMVAKLGDSITFYKVGYQIGFAGGLALARRLMDGGKQMFLDFKLHDIANTVQKGVESMAKTGATFATVHAYPRTMQAAVAGKKGTALKILAVTVLTSFDDNDLVEAGYGIKVSDLVAKRARQARDLGIDGLVCSGEEAVNLRNIVGSNVALVVPGIRPAGAAAGDQKRVMTPGKAIAAGADYLVVGRPIVDAADPKAAADAIVAEIEQAQSKRGK